MKKSIFFTLLSFFFLNSLTAQIPQGWKDYKADPEYVFLEKWVESVAARHHMDHKKKMEYMGKVFPLYKKECKEKNMGIFDSKIYIEKHPKKEFDLEKMLLLFRISQEQGYLDSTKSPLFTRKFLYMVREKKQESWKTKFEKIYTDGSCWVDLDGPNDDQIVEVQFYVDHVFEDVEKRPGSYPRGWYKTEIKYRTKNSKEWKSIKKYVNDTKMASGGPYKNGRLLMSMQGGKVDVYMTKKAKDLLMKKRTYKSDDNSQGIALEFTDNGDYQSRKFQYVGAAEVNGHDWDGQHDW